MDHFDAGVCPDRFTLDSVYENMVMVIKTGEGRQAETQDASATERFPSFESSICAFEVRVGRTRREVTAGVAGNAPTIQPQAGKEYQWSNILF